MKADTTEESIQEEEKEGAKSSDSSSGSSSDESNQRKGRSDSSEEEEEEEEEEESESSSEDEIIKLERNYIQPTEPELKTRKQMLKLKCKEVLDKPILLVNYLVDDVTFFFKKMSGLGSLCEKVKLIIAALPPDTSFIDFYYINQFCRSAPHVAVLLIKNEDKNELFNRVSKRTVKHFSMI